MARTQVKSTLKGVSVVVNFYGENRCAVEVSRDNPVSYHGVPYYAHISMSRKSPSDPLTRDVYEKVHREDRPAYEDVDTWKVKGAAQFLEDVISLGNRVFNQHPELIARVKKQEIVREWYNLKGKLREVERELTEAQGNLSLFVNEHDLPAPDTLEELDKDLLI